MRLALISAALLLCGCAGNVKLLEDGKVHYGSFNSASRTVEVDVDGVKYTGNFTQNTTVGFGQSFGTASSGTRTAYGSSFGTMVASNGSGQAVLTADNGKAIQCVFQAQMGQGSGMCEGLDGKRYIMVIGGNDSANPNNPPYQGTTQPSVCSGTWANGKCS